MHFDLGRAVSSITFARKTRNRLQLFKRASHRVIGESGHGAGQFTDQVKESSIGSEREVARSGTGGNGGIGGIVGSEDSCGGIKLVDQDLVQSEISRQHAGVSGIDSDAMRMRTFLALRIRTGALVLKERSSRAQRAIRPDRIRGNASAAVIGHEHNLAGFIDGNMARTITSGRSLIEKRQLSCACVDGVGGHGATPLSFEFIRLIGRVEEFALRIDSEKTGG